MTKVKRELESPNLDENQDLEGFLEKLNIEKKLYEEALADSNGVLVNLNSFIIALYSLLSIASLLIS